MTVRRLPLALLAPVSLLILVVALGALQYRWVGQVSEAEREQMKQSLDRRSREFAEDFDRELGRAYQLFRPLPSFSPDAPDRFTRQYEEWQTTARFPGLIKAAYFANQSGQTMALHKYNHETKSFEAVEWPASLESVRARLGVSLFGAAEATKAVAAGLPPGIVIAAMPVLPDVPALLIAGAPAMEPATQDGTLRVPGVSTSFRFNVGPTTSYVVLEIDREHVTSTVLPALVERIFPEGGSDRYRVAVLDGKSNVLLSRGLPAGQMLSAEKSDASAAFFGIRMESVKGVVTAVTGTQSPRATMMWSARASEPAAGSSGGRAGRADVTRPARMADELSMVIEQHSATVSANQVAARARGTSSWTLLLQHGAGSLDAAVGRIRTRNLWLSFGILGVLATSAFLVLVNARRSEKLAAQQLDFVATVSHELRTPVAVIRSAAQNLAAGVVHDPEQAQRYGDLIETEGRRLTDMVEQVLEYAGLSDTKRLHTKRPVDAGWLVRDVIASSESLPEAESLTFEVKIEDGAPAVMAEEDSIRRALLNLVGNAIKYGADGGWIGVTVARGTGRDEGQVSIAVSDRGRGIPAEDLPHIFKPFYRGGYARDRQIHGNGLGLSLVKGVVDAHGGRIAVTSTPGEGTTFTLVLPASNLQPATNNLQVGSESNLQPTTSNPHVPAQRRSL
ncbi:MAG TPA: HAMP domain-containing sensor histidine kinase [Vicinamibacterales bacterium]|nr:HAMP domain-containing sensor histidine kinase [Vicinamibacterales bacterium]